MGYPSDYRHDPFTDVNMAVTATERHIIPANSPYVVVLGEIPQKNSPSTMSVKEISAISGSSVTYGATFAEVAAQPATGEFFPDYNTGADGDENWNTGKILFAAADAGKMVEVTYTATGTLASVKANHYPSWMTDRGDGSDGDFCPTANTTITGEKNYKSVYIPAGVTVTVSPYAVIKCLEMFVNKGTLTAEGQSPQAILGLIRDANGEAVGNVISSEAVISAGGAASSMGITEPGIGRNTYLPIKLNGSIAFGGLGAGGSDNLMSQKGGGCIYITAHDMLNSGVISSKGTAGSTVSASGFTVSNGGGGGGIVGIAANRITNSGTITAAGGAKSGAGAAGEDGICVIQELGAM